MTITQNLSSFSTVYTMISNALINPWAYIFCSLCYCTLSVLYIRSHNFLITLHMNTQEATDDAKLQFLPKNVKFTKAF